MAVRHLPFSNCDRRLYRDLRRDFIGGHRSDDRLHRQGYQRGGRIRKDLRRTAGGVIMKRWGGGAVLELFNLGVGGVFFTSPWMFSDANGTPGAGLRGNGLG